MLIKRFYCIVVTMAIAESLHSINSSTEVIPTPSYLTSTSRHCQSICQRRSNFQIRQHTSSMPTSPMHITKSDFRTRYIRPTVAHFVTEFSLSGLPAHSKFLLSVEGGQISAQLRCDYCVNDEATLDEPQLKKRKATYIDLAGRSGSKGE